MKRSIITVLAVGLGTVVSGLLLFFGISALRSNPDDVDPVELGVTRQANGAVSSPTVPPTAANVAAPDAAPTMAAPTTASGRAGGCGKPPGALGLRKRTSMLGLRRRDWVAYVPSTYDSQRRHPVVLVFHGMFGGARAFIEESKLAPLADEEGFVMIAVQSQHGIKAWKDVDDIEAVARALEEARATLCLDDTRVYSLGHGRGGWFARDLACYMPLSGIATSGAGQHLREEPCRPIPPVPTIRMYGRHDKLVPAAGGIGCMGQEYLSADKIDERWASGYNCNVEPVTWLSHPEGHCEIRRCDEDARYVSCNVDGGHDWPGAAPSPTLPSCQSAAANFPYRDTMWKFLKEEGRRL